MTNNYRQVNTGQDPIFSNNRDASPNLGIHSFNQGITKTKQCNTRNGITTCKDENEVSRPCQGFLIGGNCAGQNTAIDNNVKETVAESVKNNFQMGHFGGPNKRFGLNRIKPPLADVRTRHTTIATTFSTPMTTTTSRDLTDATTGMSPELQEMRDHIMEMDAHDLRDAIMDPMMLGSLYSFKMY